MNDIQSQVLSRVRWPAFGVGLIGVAASIVGRLISPEQFYRSYLIAYLFWIGLPLGCLLLLLLHHVSGGAWGAVLLRWLEAGAWTLPLMALLFIPILFGLPSLYPWARPNLVAVDPVLQHKAIYLNPAFFIVRSLLYFCVWITITALISRLSLKLDQAPDPVSARRLQRVSAVGLVLSGLLTTFAAIDWMMSLEPHWYSTIYGIMIAMGFSLAAFAFIVLIVASFSKMAPLAEVISRQLLNDLGSLLLAFVMLWAYLIFSQFLIIWSGNIPEEAIWYARRQERGWQFAALAIIVFNGGLPFMLLLSRELKRKALPLAWVAGLVFVAHLVEVYWLVAPAFESPAFSFSWLDLALPLGLGGLWIAAFVWRLQRHPLLPRRILVASSQPEVKGQAHA